MSDKTRDVYITRNAGASKGFYLTQTPEGKRYTKSQTQDSTPPLPTAESRGGLPAQPLEWISQSWHRGAGYNDHADKHRFSQSLGVDPREYGVLQLAQLPVTCTGAMTSNADRYYEYSVGSLHCAAGTQLWKLTGTTWALAGTTAQNITSLASINGRLAVGQASGNFYLWDNVTLTQKGVAREKFYVDRSVLWGSSGQTIYSTDDPTDDDLWTTGITIGETGSDITNLRVFNSYLFTLKTDGAYKVQPDGTVRCLWDGKKFIDAENGKHAVVWRNNLIFSVAGGSLLMLTSSDIVVDVSPSTWGDYDVGVCNGLAETPNYLLAVFGTDLWAGWLEVVDSSHTMRWFKITDEPTCEGIHWYDDKIFYGKTTATNYIPFVMTPDHTTVGRTTGWLETSNYDGGFPGRDKVWHTLKWNLPTCPASTSVKFEYSADGGAYVTITTVSATSGYGSQTITPFKAKQVRIKATLTGTGATASPTVKWMKLEGYTLPKTDVVFEFEVRCEDEDGVRGWELSDHLFAAATDDLPPTLVDPRGTSYLIRFDPGYPREVYRAEEGENPQLVCQVRAWEIRGA